MWIIVMTSVLLGMVWNIKGYFANRRVVWEEVFGVKVIRTKGETQIRFNYFIKHCLMFGFTIAALAGGIIYILSTISDDTVTLLNDIGNNTFIVLFVSLVTLYVKKYIDIYFSIKKEDEIKKKLCPRVITLLNDMEEGCSEKTCILARLKQNTFLRRFI